MDKKPVHSWDEEMASFVIYDIFISSVASLTAPFMTTLNLQIITTSITRLREEQIISFCVFYGVMCDVCDYLRTFEQFYSFLV